VLDVIAVDGDPTGTIGLGGVEVLVESEPDEGVTGGGFWPLGITIGVDGAPPTTVATAVAAAIAPVQGRRRPAFGVA
jgi:hypothetical protein